MANANVVLIVAVAAAAVVALLVLVVLVLLACRARRRKKKPPQADKCECILITYYLVNDDQCPGVEFAALLNNCVIPVAYKYPCSLIKPMQID